LDDDENTVSRKADRFASDPPPWKQPRKDPHFDSCEPIRVDESDETSEGENKLLEPVFSPRWILGGNTESPRTDGRSESTPPCHRNGSNRGTGVAKRDGERRKERDHLVGSLVEALQRVEWMTDTMFAQVLEAAQWAVETNPEVNRADELESIATYKLAELTGCGWY
jgi:hypothetical protein